MTSQLQTETVRLLLSDALKTKNVFSLPLVIGNEEV